MEELTKQAVRELGIMRGRQDHGLSARSRAMAYSLDAGVVVNGKIKHTGKPLPSLEKVKEMIKGA